ncbi:DEKNAAC100068 [Brettanomyces naardenensis]|uniref:DEKNAAC100068 n=1 Tax=Brettanomyces naardenensis TaxID=13370 RepID=A0A448YEN8_BRENA|nr:DEKNAAC100068 [Brettanomyces naardenensis]
MTDDIGGFRLSLKDNLQQIRKAKPEERAHILTSLSLPLLKSYLTALKKTDNDKDDVFPILGSVLRFLCYEETEVLALMIVIQLRSSFGDDLLGSEILDQIEDISTTAETRADRYAVIRVITKLYPVMIGTCTELFQKNDTVVKLLANEITFLLGSNDVQLLYNDADNLKSMLDLFSSSCIDGGCRKIVAQMYLGLLVKVLKLDSNDPVKLSVQCMAATIIIKVWSSITKEAFKTEAELLSLEHLSELLINGLIRHSDKCMVSYSVEGLAFLSLNTEIKQTLRKDDNFITSLLDGSLMTDREVAYGVLCIVANLSSYNKVLSKRQQSVEALRGYSDLSNVDPRTGKRAVPKGDNDEDIARFVSYLLDSKSAVDKITEALKSSSSRGVQSQAIQIICNFCYRSESRASVVKHGGLSLILSYLVGHSEAIKYNKETFCDLKKPIEDPETRLLAIKSLARIIMSHNPSALFHDNFNIVTPVPFLLEVVVQYDINVDGTIGKTPLSGLGGEAIESVDCFESLIALVNLSSVNNMKVKDLVTKLGWNAIYSLVFSSNYQIQRADLELLSNMMLSPLCSEKFFNWETPNDENYKNFEKLCQLMALKDSQSQLAVLNIFANCSDYEIIMRMLADSTLFQDKLTEVMKDQSSDEDVQLRCLYILENLLQSSDDNSGIWKKARTELQSLVANEAESAHNDEVCQMAKDIIAMLRE